MMLYSAVSLRSCQKEHWEKLIYWVGGWSNCLGPSQRVGWFWEIKSIIWQDTSIFSSAVLRQETQGLHPVNIPSFLLPYLLSLSDTSRLTGADPYSWWDADLSEGSCAAGDCLQGEGYCPETQLQHLQQTTQKQDRTWGEWKNYKILKGCKDSWDQPTLV